jgi:hypothetical protein
MLRTNKGANRLGYRRGVLSAVLCVFELPADPDANAAEPRRAAVLPY